MKSLSNYSKTQLNYFNSFNSTNIYNQQIALNESQLILSHGSNIDSVLYKLNKCTSRYNENLFFENQDDVLFTIDEQYAARDILLLTCKLYVESLCEEYNIEVPILESTEDTVKNLKGFINKVGQYAKEKGEEFKDEVNKIGDRIKAVKEFIQQITSKAIKSAKELAEKFLDLMISLKSRLSDILSKLGAKIDEIQEEFKESILNVINNKADRPKENIYENLQNALKSGHQLDEDLILEFSLFGKKKSKEDDDNKDEKSKGRNEYEKSLDPDKKKGIKSKGKTIIVGILKQIAISTTILVLLPSLIGCVWGPAAAMIAATIAKAAMTGYGFYRLCKNIYLTIKSSEWKEKSKWAKLGHVIIWMLSFALLAWGASKMKNDFVKIWDAFSKGNLKTLVPDEMVQGGMKIINNIYKALTGKDTPGFEELQKITTEGITTWESKEEVKGKTNDNFTSKELKNLGDTNDFKNIENNLGKEVTDELKKATEATLKSSKSVQDAFTNAVDPSKLPSDTHIVFVDGNTAAKMVRTGLIGNTNGAEVAVNQITNTSLQAATNGQAGTMFMVAIKGSKDAATDILSQASSAAGKHGVDFLGKMISGTATETVVTQVPHTVAATAGGFAPIVGLPIITKKKVDKGFLLRLGSSRSKNKVYIIRENDIKGMAFKDIESKYGSNNTSVFEEMKKIINKNYKTLEKAKENLEKKSNPSKSEKKLIEGITKQLEKMKDGISEYECLVFFSKKDVESQNTENQTNEGLLNKLFSKEDKPEVKEIEYQPVMFVNPICMACGDLANITEKKGPRKNPIYLKGLFASYEFLPGEEGMTEKDINEMLQSIALESLKTAWNMSADAPCTKKAFKKYVENEESIFKGQPRDDFGKLTNSEITEIFNNPSSITKYMGGKYSTKSTVEKENTENQKKRKENAKKEWKDNIENNDEIKKIIDDSPSLKKNLVDNDGKVKDGALDDLSDAFLRMETSYNKGKSKKSLWKRIKDFFTGSDAEDKEKNKYDPDEVQKLAYKLASLHSKNLKSKRSSEEVKESLNIELIEELDESIKYFDMNLEDLLSEEFYDFLNNEDMVIESLDDEDDEIILYDEI